MSDTSTKETSVSDVPNRSDVQIDSESLFGLYDTDDDFLSGNVPSSRMTPESLEQIRKQLELNQKEREESIEWKLESSVQDLRRLFEEVISLYNERIQFLLERTQL